MIEYKVGEVFINDKNVLIVVLILIEKNVKI